jgi:hypothetical protein
MNLLTRAIKRIFGGGNTPVYINSDDKWEIYPNKYMLDNGETEVSHIALTDKYPDAKVLVDYFNLNPEKVVFFVQTNKAEIPYSNPIAILNDMGKNMKEVFVKTSEYLSLDTYLYNVKVPYHAYRRDRHDFGDIIQISGGNGNSRIREELNSIFHSLPTEISLLQSMFGTGTRTIPEKLRKYISKLDLTEKNSPIFHSLVFADKTFRENLKAFEGKYLELKQKSTSKERIFPSPHMEFDMMSKKAWEEIEKERKEGKIVDLIDYKKLFDSIAEIFPEFAKIWEIEKKRVEFILANKLDNWFLFNLFYIPYTGYQSSSFEGKSVKNVFMYLIFALDELYDDFLPALEKGEFDSTEKNYPGYHFGNHKVRDKDIEIFFKIVKILDDLDDGTVISFVNMDSPVTIQEQIEKDTQIVIAKLPVIDSQNEEINIKMQEVARNVMFQYLQGNEIIATVHFF